MKKLISIGLLVLLLCHTLAYMLVSLSISWQAEHDLSEKLLVYRSTDSLVEFLVPLKDKPDAEAIAHTTSGGFRYNGHYYGVVSVDVRGDTLCMTGLEVKSHSIWPDDLLAFLNEHLIGDDNGHQKASQLLKGLLKDYSPHTVDVFCFSSFWWQETSRIPDHPFSRTQTTQRVNLPPPRS